jgi:DNA modification methylase
VNKVYWGDCRDSMRQMKQEGIKVQTCVTSPPYYGLRDYGTGTWIGGDETCSHKRDSKYSDKTITGHANKDLTVGDAIYKTICPKCGAVRKDLQIGLEETPQEFIDNLVEVFACVWDILADDGTLWVNLGDSYYNYRPGKGQALNKQSVSNTNQDLPQTCARRGNKLEGYKEKDLMGMPWRLAFALQDFGWYLRQDIIWHKPNPMPESVKDRCTKSHEYIFLLSKKPQYYFDYLAIQEPSKEVSLERAKSSWNPSKLNISIDGPKNESFDSMGDRWVKEMANKRDVWTVNTKSYKGAHFATYPEELIEPMILAGSKVGDIVLDPFFGSGTTGQVSQQLGRKWIGCELNKDYEKLQNERVSQQGLEFI